MNMKTNLSGVIETGKPYILITGRPGANEYSMIIDEVSEGFLIGWVGLNRFVIAKRSRSGQTAKIFVGNEEEASQEDVIVKEECVYATRKRLIARIDGIDLIEDNWRTFLPDNVVDRDGTILDIQALVECMPRFSMFVPSQGNNAQVPAEASLGDWKVEGGKQ